ncbi:glycosyltransferase family 2 protein, partial [Phocaeicola vulgatus]|nr:glycosyltransferase family 2 protein [Phocaeicola vulgatus]
MKWYADYLSIYDKPFTQAPQAVINQVKDKIRQLATHAPLVSVVAIAHNEEKRILS